LPDIQGVPPKIAFVLGGGGMVGAHEVGMLRALSEAGIEPDVVLGTSIGAINGAMAAARPGDTTALTELWRSGALLAAFDDSLARRVGTFVRSGTHLQANDGLAMLLSELLPVHDFGKLHVPFQCVAASIERAAAHWFTEGPIVPAVLASCAVPGLLPPVRIGSEHFLDGGLVHSIPVGRAVELGAETVYVLHVGRIERPLTPPRRPWQVGLIAFEIARRHRFFEEMSRLPDGVAVHVLPAGATGQLARGDLSPLRYRDTSRIDAHIERAYRASVAYLEAAA
jgi:NTE family protein